MLGSNGEVREDDDWELFDRDGKMAARVRQEGDGYWVGRPRMTPEPPIESFEAACCRAVNVAMTTLDWPASERHAVHPGMLAAQFNATCATSAASILPGLRKRFTITSSGFQTVNAAGWMPDQAQ